MRARVRCNKANECSGIIEKNKSCPHYAEHELFINTTGKPYWRITCGKADQCLNGIREAFCVGVKDNN